MWQFRARPVITAASTHLLLRTCGNTTHSSSQIRRLNECFSHTPTTSLNIQFGPSKGIINGFCVWAAPAHKPTVWVLTQKTLNEKENACGSGSQWAANELPPQGSFPPIPGIKVNGEDSQKSSAEWLLHGIHLLSLPLLAEQGAS